MKPLLNVSYAFVRLGDTSLDDFGRKILKGMTGNAAYPEPPVSMQDLNAVIVKFAGALAANETGGKVATAAKNNVRAELTVVLRKLADYVQTAHGNDMATLLSSGFGAISTNRARVALGKPGAPRVKNGNSGQLLITVPRMANVKFFEIRFALVAADGSLGPWQRGAFSSRSRNMSLDGLTPGQLYVIAVRAIGGSTGQSDWSDPVEHRSL